MGKTLVAFFDAIKKEGGLPAQMRLAMKAGMSSDKAATAPDSPDAIAKFRAAYREITGKDAPVR